MENLLRNLQEQENHLKHRFNIHDLASMEYINDREAPVPPHRKYVSIFRIDGEPILPPLMTAEKRRQMQKIKEKALKVEQHIRERKQLLNKENDKNNEDIISITSRSSAFNTAGNVSKRSEDYYEVNLKETEESMMLLQNLIKKQGEHKNDNIAMEDSSGCDTKPSGVKDNQEKLLKLQKSEILIFDNCTNEVIQITPDNDTKTREDHKKQLIELERKANLNYLPPKKPSHLLLAGVDLKGIPSIPSICLNPPTPLTGNRNICDQLNSTQDNSNFITNSKTQNESLCLVEDICSDDSFNSMLTHADRSLKNLQNKPKHTTKTTEIPAGLSNNKKSTKKILNVSNRIEKFETLSSETNTPPSSPEKSYQRRTSCIETHCSTMNRSATSPSIKLPTSQRSSSRSQRLAQDSDNSPECILVRSSSFTLEAPSKALIDHMKQQKTINDAKRNVKTPLNSNRTITRKTISSPLRSHRDTVESKAKRVQKVELKSSKQKILQKTSQSKLEQAAASLSPYNSNSLSQHSHHHLYQTKKSPYDTTKTMQNSLQTIQKSKPSTTRKSPPTSSSITQTKSIKTQVLSSPMQTPTSNPQNSVKSATGKKAISQMDKTQKEKFLRLLAQQEEEHRRLQQSFEIQQKMLIDQLNTEMGTIQKKSPTNSNHSLSTNSSSQSQENQRGQQSQLTHLQNQLNIIGFSTDTKSDKPLFSHSPQTSPTISNSSSQLYFTNTQPEAVIVQQTSFSSHYDQPPVPATPTTSNLSSIDHSNANTSLDISTLSNQTSPDNLCSTTPTNISNSFNMSGNKSSSRRRLFTSDMTTVQDTRSTVSSPYPICQSTEHTQQQQHRQLQHKSSKDLSHNSSNRRPIEQETLVQHAAATKINACARGFLVRRLFQTEQIQRIVQTIRDTLIFVLNLHLETMENPKESHTPVNIKLKARLLQQLTSACRTLHLVFFQTSIKERMEIIARDRKRIKTKLLSMNRKR